jgi:hypothetical protein
MEQAAVGKGRCSLNKGKGEAGDVNRKAVEGGGGEGEGKVKMTAEERDRQKLKRQQEVKKSTLQLN